MIFTHSGNSGDIVFSIPLINHLTNGNKIATLYIKTSQYVYGNQYDFVKDFLLQQDGIKEVIPFTPPDNNWAYFNWPGIKKDYDLDEARNQRNRGVIHIVKRYFDAFGVVRNIDIPFLKIDELEKKEGFAIIHLTPRWNGLQYDWAKIYLAAKEKHNRVYFIGFQHEWLDFTLRFGSIEHLPTENLLQMARLIRDCDALYCNQGVALTIAQGLGKENYLVMNANKTNCHLGTVNEHLLGREWLAHNNTFSANQLPDSHLKTKFK
jgi:hypothetical protein